MELSEGRPTNEQGRLEKELRVYDFLDSLRIRYQRIDHNMTQTMEACAEIDRVLCAAICKNLFLCNRQKTAFYLLMISGDKQFKTKDISAQIGSSRLSFADEEHMLRYLDITPGSVSVMGLLNDKDNRVCLLIDREVVSGEYIGCHPCINTSSIRIRTVDFLEKVLPALGHNTIYVNV